MDHGTIDYGIEIFFERFQFWRFFIMGEIINFLSIL